MEKNKKQKNYKPVCEKCDKKYSKLHDVKNGELDLKSYYPDCDCDVVIRLKKNQIPAILGAIFLGKKFEVLCRMLVRVERYEEDFIKAKVIFSKLWKSIIDDATNKIKEQSGIDLKYYECAMDDDIVEKIFMLVYQECINRIKDRYENIVKKRNIS